MSWSPQVEGKYEGVCLMVLCLGSSCFSWKGVTRDAGATATGYWSIAIASRYNVSMW